MFCCHSKQPSTTPAHRAPRASWFRRAFALVQWSLPIATLALIPKCPICFAGYILLFTGLGLSFSQAALARWSLISLSLLALAFLTLRLARRVLRARHLAAAALAPSAKTR